MDFKPLLISKIREFFNSCPQYTTGEILYSVMSKLPRIDEKSKMEVLHKATDQQLYEAVCKAMNSEKENT